jgi:type II restriction/modification system DNA methylase subunit YeeA
LVENSLGRLWLLNHPQSKLAEKMPYYIAPTQPETDFLVITLPEDLKVCDPACGSGHMLTYAFDLLYAIYEEALYEVSQIPQLILSKNLFGIEIDERAAALAAFALTMKARAKQSRFLAKSTKTLPNICHLQPVTFEQRELEQYMDLQGKKLFTNEIKTLLTQFEEADNFGSLIRPVVLKDTVLRTNLEEKGIGSHLFLAPVHEDVLRVLGQAEFLQPRYQVVVANPPYMGGGGMNGRLATWVKKNYPDSKSDLFAVFMERSFELAHKSGLVGMITMQSWMFLSSYESLRAKLLNHKTLVSMAHLGARGFDSIGGEVVQTTAFVLKNHHNPDFKGDYVRLIEGNSEAEKSKMFVDAVKNSDCGWFYRACASDFKKVPSIPIAYSAGSISLDVFAKLNKLDNRALKGLDTNGSIELFLKRWFEVSVKDFSLLNKNSDKWYPIAKGGEYRKWYGNNDFAINYANNGYALKANKANLRSAYKYFEKGLTWTVVSSSGFAVRYMPEGFLFDQGGSGIFLDVSDNLSLFELLGSLNSAFVRQISKLFCPTLNFTTGDVRRFPVFGGSQCEQISKSCLAISKSDWDSYETSWDFTTLPLLQSNYHKPTIQATYSQLRSHWQTITNEMQRLEQENNRIFIEAYGLQDELTPEVPLKEITLTCNPYYRYGGDKTPEELDTQLLTDTIKEFISYAVGCMFGRYSLDKEGLVLANQGQTLADYLQQIPQPRFMPDEDNVIPILDKDWFSDDITERFKEFLKVSFGKDSFEENINFIQEALGKKGKAQTIRDYFLKDFYNDHVRRYKKRPIYWLFSSPKGSFNALIYVHRYQTDTVSVVLNSYLREFRTKLVGHKAHLEQLSISDSASQSDKTKAVKDLEALKKVLTELDDYESDILYPLATQQIAIDLDDGVKVNYGKLGAALKKIVGLDTGDD